MTEASDKNAEKAGAKNPVPVPYSVLAVGWAVSILGANAFLPQVALLAWLGGPAVMLLKLISDADRFAFMKDNPEPKEYKFHAAGVYECVDQAIRTIGSEFPEAAYNQPLKDLEVKKKDQPLQVDYSIKLRHDEKGSERKNTATSLLYIYVFITPKGNNCQLKFKFKCTGDRLKLEEMIDYIVKRVDELVIQKK